MTARALRIDAFAVVDPCGPSFSPGALILELEGRGRLPAPLHGREVPWGACRVLAAGPPELLDAHPASAVADRVALPDHVVLPGLVNAHTHLDLTHIGPRPPALDESGAVDFTAFAGIVMRERVLEDPDIEASVRRGIQLQLEAGTVAVGDIAGNAAGEMRLAPGRTLRASALAGVSFVEFFAMGVRAGAALARLDSFLAVHEDELRSAGAVRFGLSPHAPYSVEPAGYARALDAGRRLGLPVATHLAESGAEHEFVARGRGPFRTFLERLGLWEPRLEEVVGKGLTPVRHLAEFLASGELVAVHVADADDADLLTLGAGRAPVVYCPRAARYFGAPSRFGPHRWREMLARGVRVALGTDSIINLPPGSEAPGAGRFSVLGEMRTVWAEISSAPNIAPGDAAAERDLSGISRELLRMATVHGASVLGLDPKGWTFEPGAKSAGVAAVRVAACAGDPLVAVLESWSPAELIVLGRALA